MPFRRDVVRAGSAGLAVSAAGCLGSGGSEDGEVGYRGPAPPEGDGPHTYRFTLSAVDGTVDIRAGADRPTLREALDGRTLATARLTGEYER